MITTLFVMVNLFALRINIFLSIGKKSHDNFLYSTYVKMTNFCTFIYMYFTNFTLCVY